MRAKNHVPGLAVALLLSGGLVTACQESNSASANKLQGSAAFSPSSIAYVRLPAHLVTKEFVEETGFNRDHVRDDEFAFGYLTHDALSALPHAVFSEVVELDAQAWSEHRFDPRTLQILDDGHSFYSTEVYEDYHNYDALTRELQDVAARYPDLVKLETAGKSVDGRELWYVKISDNAKAEENEPNLLYIANMHGDEVVGREMMIYLIRELTSQYASSARIKALVDHAQIFIMPSMNPDGFELRQRYNSRGVDLNRNFPDFTSDPTDSVAGRAAETANVMRMHDKYHFITSINFHGGEVCFNIPWDTKVNDRSSEKFGDDALMQLASHNYANLNATMRQNSSGSFDHGVTYGYEWYEVDGGMQDWHDYYRSGIQATIELSYTKWPNASQLPGMWGENKEAMLGFLEQSLKGMHFHVVTEDGQEVQAPVVRVASADRDVTYRSSYVTRPAVGEAQQVTVSAPGFKPTKLVAAPWVFDGTYRDVVLTR